MFSGYESLNLRPLHLKTRCTIIYWFGMSISKCCDVIKHFPYSRAVLLIATVYTRYGKQRVRMLVAHGGGVYD